MKFIQLLLTLMITTSLFSAENIDPSFTYGKYISWDHGVGTGSFRDEGTSPLTYSGFAAKLGVGYLSEKKQYSWEIQMNANYMLGFITQGYQLHNLSGDIQLSYLHTIPIFENKQLSLKAGGRLSTSFSGTMNDAYQNASFNYDIFSSLYARAQFTYAFIKPEKQKKRRIAPEKHFALVCNLDLPVMLLNFRPEFPYVMDGNMISVDRHIFIGGYSMQNHIGLKRFFNNGNAFELSYIWKMYLTGKKDIYRMETASHILQFSYYFKLD